VQARTRALAEQQRLLRQILAQVPAAIVTLKGPEHRFVFANPLYQQLVGGRTQVGKTVAEMLPEIAEQGFVQLLDDVYRTGQVMEGREVGMHLTQPDGATAHHYFDFTYQPLPDEQGQTKGLLVFAVDVTERVRSGQQAAALQARLLASAQNLAAERLAFFHIFEQAPVLVALLRAPIHTFEYVNPAFQALFLGRQLIGRPVAEVVPEMQEQGFVALMDDTYQTGETYVGRELLFTTLPAEGHPAHQAYYNFTYQAYWENGQLAGISIFAHDVSEQVRSRQQVERLNQELTSTNADLHTSNTQLRRSNVDLDNFIYTASHDLKAPISNIEGLLLALEHELPAAGRVGDVPVMLTMMQEATERFQRTIRHLTSIAHLQQTQGQDQETVPLAPVVQAVYLDLLPLITQSMAQVAVQVPADVLVTFSEKNLRSVVYNLLSNALKYRHPDRRPQVHLRAWQQESYRVLEVGDNGLGLDLAQGQEKLFAMFQRLHTHVEGTGLGLYMVKKIVENAGGRIEVASQLGQGSTFRVYFAG
jgi:PAS domain S-box-containing protein